MDTGFGSRLALPETYGNFGNRQIPGGLPSAARRPMTGRTNLVRRILMTTVRPMPTVRRSLLLALALLPAACGSAPSPHAAKPAEETSGFWRGTATRFQVESRACPRPGLVTIQVWDDKFQYRWDNKTWIDAEIAADNVVRGQAPGIMLVGKIAGKRMEGDVTNGDCGLHFTVVKSDT